MDIHGAYKGIHRCTWDRERKVADALGNVLIQGRTTTKNFPGFCAMYNSLNGPLSLLWEP
jgi:hypothetical protein